jgi:hypothetical protein
MAGLLRRFIARACRIDAAQRPEVAMTAGFRRELRVDNGASGRVITRERIEPGPPALGNDTPVEAPVLVFRQREISSWLDPIDRDRFLADAEETRARAAGFGERDRSRSPRVQDGVQRELRGVHARTAPRRTARPTRLVVDHDEIAACIVDPIDAKAELEPADVTLQFALRLDHDKWRSGSFELEQCADGA